MSFSELANVQIGSFSLGNLCSAAITLLVCLLAVRAVEKLLRRLLSATKLDSRIQKYTIRGVKLVLYLITILIVMENLGIPVASLVALVSVGSLGVTLAAEDILANVAGGLVILSSHPFAIGDFIQAGDASGTVEEITLNHTKLINPDGQVVLVPNKTLSSSQMTNFTALGRRRVTQKVTASYDAPTETVKEACREALADTPSILPDPAPAVYLTEYGASSIEYTVYCWSKPEDYWNVFLTLGENLRSAFDAYGVEMTYDHLNVHIVESKG
jgi:small conductance mechanosensitive channel